MPDEPNPVDEALSELGHSTNGDLTRVDIYLDDVAEPLVSYRPPVHFEIDTTLLDDGPHKMRVEAFDRAGTKGVRTVNFTVRNGPGIAIHGVRDNDQLDGTVPVLVNAYGGAHEEHWEPARAETPAPIPTWAWVLFLGAVAWSMFYAARTWAPSDEMASSPTFSGWGDEAPRVGAAPAATTVDGGAGAALYRTSCASCHQSNGVGLEGVFPPLAGDPVVLDDDATRHIEIILFGLDGEAIGGVQYPAAMPGFAAQLSDAEVAAVVNHERTSWGNQAPTVTVDEVAEVRRGGAP